MHTLSPHPGTRPSASGNSLPALQPVVLLATLMMSSPFHSPPTTVKSSLAPAIVLSSSGTLSETASTLSPTRVTLSGFRAFDSARTPKTRLSLALDGTRSSRYVVALVLRCGGRIHMMLYVLQKYLLLQSLRAMRTTNTNVLISRSQKSAFNKLESQNGNHSSEPLLIEELGLGISHLQNPDRSHRPYRIHQHRDHFS